MTATPFLEARSIALAGGGEMVGRHSALIPGPGHSRRDRSLCVTVDPSAPGGFVVFSYAGDDPIGCRDYVRHLLGIPAWRAGTKAVDWTPSPEQVEAARRREQEAADKAARRFDSAMRLWAETVCPVGTIVETYLRSRNLSVPDAVVEGGHLRFHSACPVKVGGQLIRLPAMVALMTDAVTAEPRAVHRTFLRTDGSGKAHMPDGGTAKKMLGEARGAVIRLSPDDGVTMGLGLAEGIENALTALSVGWMPVWAAGSAGNMAAFPVFGGVEYLTVFADRGEAGERAADTCATRWADAGREAEVIIPVSADLNDALREVAA